MHVDAASHVAALQAQMRQEFCPGMRKTPPYFFAALFTPGAQGPVIKEGKNTSDLFSSQSYITEVIVIIRYHHQTREEEQEE
jgi:hypothetical protein